ncbi:MAG: hypothetical protein M2R45_04753 [Verrucomicrobia subdivision 3 bacterium]|nr:hypothetical protein [Limisphaerales bacterium]MCS1415082.1 hypothetical protein [Limisphaerales bacterium]
MRWGVNIAGATEMTDTMGLRTATMPRKEADPMNGRARRGILKAGLGAMSGGAAVHEMR